MSVKAIEYMNALVESGVDRKQAEVMAKGIEVLTTSSQSELITRQELKSELKGLESSLIKWMIGTAMGILVIVFSVVFTVMELRMAGVETLIEQNRQAIEQNRQAIEQNREAINQNRVLINQNREAIRQVQLSVQKLIDIHLEQAKK